MKELPKYITTLCLVSVSIYAFAQKSGAGIDKSVKKLFPGISYVPAKTFNSLAHNGTDSAATYSSRISSVQSFYIAQAEVTNKEYRDFVHYIRDSLAHHLLGHFKNGSEIDWKQNIDWNDNRLDAMMTPPDQRLYGKKEIDPERLNMEIEFFGQKEIVNVYPDTLRWISDFSYSYNEVLVKRYFSHPMYNNYPVVGVSLKQALAFCQWKTNQVNANVIVRLPTNAEWESAAIGGNEANAVYPATKKFDCNSGVATERDGAVFKGQQDDGFFYTAPVKSFAPNTYALYDMKGNVSEWTSTALDEIKNVEVKPDKQKRLFIVKGGGWNSPPYYLQPGVCQFYNAGTANTWIGFRYVVEVKKD